MLDTFFQKLRKIQKRETNENGLARVGPDFYPKVDSYINMLRDKLESNPFADEEHRLLKNTQIIASDICARREHKIADIAVNNIQRAYLLFKGKQPQFDSQDTTPLNLTPEEEQLYFSLMDTLRGHRTSLFPSLNNTNIDKRKNKDKTNSDNNNQSYLFEPQEKDVVVDILDETGKSDNNVSENAEVKSSINKENSQNNVDFETKEDIGASDNVVVQDTSSNVKSEVNPSVVGRVEIKKEINEPGVKDSDGASDDVYASIYAADEFVDLPPEVPIKHYETPKNRKKVFNPDKISFKTLIVFDEVPSIVGVDEKIYGPFYPQDIVKMPELNADLFRKQRKGRFVKI